MGPGPHRRAHETRPLCRPPRRRLAGRRPDEPPPSRTETAPRRSALCVSQGIAGMTIEIRVPGLGESVTEATDGKWLKAQGEAVRADEPLVELETDKVTVEVPAPQAGVLSE